MKTHLILSPYDSGFSDFRMGLGPARLVDDVTATLRRAGHEVEIGHVDVDTRNPPSEVLTGFEVDRQLAERVRATCEAGVLPVVLAGNCMTACGTLAGLKAAVGVGSEDAGLIWFDTHGDFNTPDSSVTGFLDGMAVTVATGHCWRTLANSIPGFEPIAEERVLLAGVRDLDDAEADLLAESAVSVVGPDGIPGPDFANALRDLRQSVSSVYLHVDLDVIDRRDADVNWLQTPGGVRLEALKESLRLIRETFELRAIALTAYDPGVDPAGTTPKAVIELIDTIFAD